MLLTVTAVVVALFTDPQDLFTFCMNLRQICKNKVAKIKYEADRDSKKNDDLM